ncbi:14694_t:CDS:1 [Ambispora leptoticha]|uniref:14694_t:CDS:1 n=1 Tax=Ambispora leptoticha TaxID=144679 RepID=A0A9N8ZIM2_9GLOM|nr:14694_t:CDS:1 [Ambispora leptoticha]
MDEEIKKHCSLLMFDMPPPTPQKDRSLMIDFTSSLENSNIRSDNNFVFTSFVEPIKVKRSLKKTKKNNDDDYGDRNKNILNLPITSPLNNFIDETKQTQLSEKKHIRRPPNAFILYRQAKQPELTAEMGHMPNTEISRILSVKWANEPEKEKLHWQKQADKMKMEHALANPGYVYRPSPRKSPFKTENKKGNRGTKKKRKSQSTCEQPVSNFINSSIVNAGEIINVVSSSEESSLQSPFFVESNNFHPVFYDSNNLTPQPYFSNNDGLIPNQLININEDEITAKLDATFFFNPNFSQNWHSQDPNHLCDMPIQQQCNFLYYSYSPENNNLQTAAQSMDY